MSDASTEITLNPPSLIASQPSNINFLSPLGFRFTLKRSPHTNFFVTNANIPSLSLGTANMPSPFKNIPFPGDKPSFTDFALTFKVDENMTNYLEIYNWLLKIGFPENFDQYASVRNAGSTTGQGIQSDATLTILNSAMNPTVEVKFENMYPIDLTELRFNTQDTTLNYIEATATFKFTYMRLVPVT